MKIEEPEDFPCQNTSSLNYYSLCGFSWNFCRSVYHVSGKLPENDYFFMSILPESVPIIVSFMTEFEKRINKKDSLSLIRSSKRKYVYKIKANHFWLDAVVRYELLTILLRACTGYYFNYNCGCEKNKECKFDGVYRKEEDFMHVIDKCKLLENNLKKFVLKFIDGFDYLEVKDKKVILDKPFHDINEIPYFGLVNFFSYPYSDNSYNKISDEEKLNLLTKESEKTPLS